MKKRPLRRPLRKLEKRAMSRPGRCECRRLYKGKEELLSGVLLVQGGAHGKGRVGIDGVIAFFDKLDDALLVDDDVGAQSPLVAFVILCRVVGFEDAVSLESHVGDLRFLGLGHERSRGERGRSQKTESDHVLHREPPTELGCTKQQELTLLPGSNTTEMQKKFPNLAGGE